MKLLGHRVYATLTLPNGKPNTPQSVYNNLHVHWQWRIISISPHLCQTMLWNSALSRFKVYYSEYYWVSFQLFLSHLTFSRFLTKYKKQYTEKNINSMVKIFYRKYCIYIWVSSIIWSHGLLWNSLFFIFDFFDSHMKLLNF